MIAGASAPGKALLCGEYAVLEGAPAVVAAVDRRVRATWTDRPTHVPHEVRETLRIVERRLGSLPASIEVDVRGLQSDGVKLGLGSSAAAAAAAAGAAFAHHGHALDDDSALEAVFDCALRGHAAIAPEGSGGDVAASTFGGFLRFGASDGSVVHARLRRPGGLAVRLVWTGSAARTSDLLAQVHAFRERDPHAYHRRLGELAAIAERFAAAFETGAAREVVEAAHHYHEAMAGLGRESEAPIVEDHLASIAEIARRVGGAAKPCGAGGGDVAIAFFVDEAGAQAFEKSCADAGLRPIDVSWGAPGVRTFRDEPVDGGGAC